MQIEAYRRGTQGQQSWPFRISRLTGLSRGIQSKHQYPHLLVAEQLACERQSRSPRFPAGMFLLDEGLSTDPALCSIARPSCQAVIRYVSGKSATAGVEGALRKVCDVGCLLAVVKRVCNWNDRRGRSERTARREPNTRIVSDKLWVERGGAENSRFAREWPVKVR